MLAMKFITRCLLLSIAPAGLIGCQNEVPQKSMPGGVRSGSDYERMQSQHRGTMSPAMQDAIAKAHAKPTTRMSTTAPTAAPSTTPPAVPAAPAPQP